MERLNVKLLIIVLSGLVALATGLYAHRQFDSLIAARSFVVAAADIPPCTIITRKMLTTREFPASLEREPVYRDMEEVIGKITTINLPAGALIYTAYAVPPAHFRLAEDERNVVVSFPVRPEKAVGGQVRRGHIIILYRIALAQSTPRETDPAALLARRGAEVEVLADNLRVVDVRSSQGEPAGTERPAGTTQEERQAAGRPGGAPVTIITVEAPPAVAQEIVRLQGETKERYDLWVALAPAAQSQVSGEERR